MKENESPLVTIITPAYNRGQTYLRETIDSVLAQDYPNFEYIVLDDGSTDNTCDLLESYDDPRLRWESHDNMGETRTVNKGYRMARGEYIAIVNSDDPVLPGFIHTTVAFMESRPELLAAYPDWYWINEHSEVIWHEKSYDYNYINMLRWHITFPGSGAVVRRRAIELIPERNPELRYRADYDYWLQLGLRGPMARIPATLATFRVHPDSATVALKGEIMAREHTSVIDNVYRHKNLPPEVLAARKEAYASAYYNAGVIWVGSQAPHRARACFRKAIFTYPPSLWRWSFQRWRTMARFGLPGPLMTILRLPLILLRALRRS